MTSRIAVLTLLVGCDQPEPDPRECASAGEVCGLIAAGDWEVALATPGTSDDTWWQPTCIASIEEGEWYGDEGIVAEARAGYWFDYVHQEYGFTVRYLDCAFAPWTSFPEYLGTRYEVAGLPTGWELAADTNTAKVEELVLAVEASWHRRRGPEAGSDIYDTDYLYEWNAWEENGVAHWRFCRARTDQFSGATRLLCHEYAYSLERQLLGAAETEGAELPCDP